MNEHKIVPAEHFNLGFASSADLASARALLLDCSGFSGMEILLKREPKVFDGARVELSPGFALIPAALATSGSAGPGGPLGRGLMAAATRPSQALTPRVHLPAPLEAQASHSAVSWSRPAARALDGATRDDGSHELEASHQSPSTPVRRPSLDEGTGSESFEALVSALEDSGFGDPRTAQLIRERKAAAVQPGTRGRR